MNDQFKKLSNMNDAQMRLLLESTNAIPWVIDWTTKEFSYIGPQIERILGYPRESWVDAGVWAERIHPEDREGVVNYCISQSDKGEDHFADYRAVAKDGSVIWIRDIVHVVREDQVTKEIIGFMFDITEKKLVEEELATSKKSLEQSNSALEKLARGEPLTNIFDALTLGAEQNVKGAFASILLLDNSGTRLVDGSTPSFPEEVRDAFNGLVIGPLEASCGTAAYTKQLVIVEDISTDPRWAKYKDFALSKGLKSCHSAPILSSNGSVLGTFALTFKQAKCPTDIELEIIRSSTQIAGLAIEQKQYEENLELYAKELEDFASIASHDLQEPLRKIISFGDRLKSRIPASDERAQNYLERMQAAASRMKKLVIDLLQFSKFESKEKSIESTDLQKVVGGVLEDLEDRINYTGGKVNIKSLPVIEADPIQMHQLFLNLIGNALKFHRGGVPPVINLDTSHDGNGKCEITVEDNGIGIDKRHVDRIFKPFERLHGRSTYEGTGIGLTICKKIVTRHGGNITFKNKPTNGVTFHITLPEKQNSPED
jgi:PAS domain S-box-containing protein